MEINEDSNQDMDMKAETSKATGRKPFVTKYPVSIFEKEKTWFEIFSQCANYICAEKNLPLASDF